MENRKTSGGNFVASAAFFILSALIAIYLLLSAAVVGLAEALDSFIFSALIIGGFFAIAAVVIYLVSIREAINRMRERIETVYEVARIAKEGYDWIADKFSLFLRLLGLDGK